MDRVERVVLVGFSGAGKSTVGGLLAERLGWDLVDTDLEIERAAGRSIPDIFRTEGEAAFRERERATLAAALAGRGTVVACGGGAVVPEEVWGADLLRSAGTLVVALDADPGTSLARLERQRNADGGATERPLLAVDDPLARIRTLKAARQSAYDRADITLVVDRTTPAEVAGEIASLPGVGPLTDEPSVVLSTPSGVSRIVIRPGATANLGDLVRQGWPKAQRVWVVSDRHVADVHGGPVVDALAGAGLRADLRAVPAGEGSKSLAGASDLYDWMLGGGIERGDVVVALGGGVVGDLAGFVAATCLRGVGLVQVPTTLLAMVDSSVGGKTGINHAAGKNLIGAFYQPPLVVIDPMLLGTLPPRELASGWGEIVKHAIIQRSTPGGERGDLGRFLERNQAQLLGLREPATTYLIRRNVALKAAVVAADERESGIRAYLNFGHTLGHAIEAAGYALLHGEAIAVGMRGEARIGVGVGSCDAPEAQGIDALIDAFGLPATASVDEETVIALLGSDKKRAAGRLRWVLPIDGGGVTIRDDVPLEAVREALHAVAALPAKP